jgi:pimeloyl-ACP methyl ester carboxylesterase
MISTRTVSRLRHMPEPVDLEHLPAGGAGDGAPLLFIHGAFGAPWVWQRHFMPWFAQRGHAVYAMRLRGGGELPSRNMEPGLGDYLDDLEAAVAGLGERPVVVAHSLGALVAQMALGRVPMRALAMLAPVPSTGMLWSSVRLALDTPALWTRTAFSAGEAGFATTAATRDALFTDDTHEDIVYETHARLAVQPARPMLEAQGPRHVPRASRVRVPVLTLAAERDRLISVGMVERTAQYHGAPCITMPGAGHAMMLDTPWLDSARAIAHWLAGRRAGQDAA